MQGVGEMRDWEMSDMRGMMDMSDMSNEIDRIKRIQGVEELKGISTHYDSCRRPLSFF